MKKDPVFYVFILVLTVVDAWLLAHPNLIGRLGILFYKYSMIKTFPAALVTVGLTVSFGLVINFVASKLAKQTALLITGGLTLVSVGILISTFFKFSAGSYAMTGAGFKTGAILLPIILMLTFGKGVYDTLVNVKV